MKKTLAAVFLAAGAVCAFAAEPAENEPARAPARQSAVWPAVFAFCEWPDTPDLIGLRLAIPFSTKQESITGFDIGFWGRCKDMEGLQVNVLRNDVKDTFCGIQAGLYNTANRADMLCVQCGLINETQSFRGVQCGLVNMTGDGQGFQVGLINRAETFYGLQVGVVNVIRDAEFQMLPIANIGF